MGILCCCPKKKKPNNDEINTSLINSNVQDAEDMDEWEIKDLKNQATTQIAIIEEGAEPGPPRNINVEDFQFLKVHRSKMSLF